MRDPHAELTSLAREVVSLDSRSFASNLPIADRIESALAGFDVGRLGCTGSAKVVKRALVAH